MWGKYSFNDNYDGYTENWRRSDKNMETQQNCEVIYA